MLEKVKAGWSVLKAGEVVANPTAWKRGQITTLHLVALLSSIVAGAKAFGYEIPLDESQQAAIATVILWVVGLFNHYATVASTDKIDALGRTRQQSVQSMDSTSEESKSEDTAPYKIELPSQGGYAPVYAPVQNDKSSDTTTDFDKQRANDSLAG